MLDTSIIGKSFPEFRFTIERGKVREFVIAVGDSRPETDVELRWVPPTFPTVFSFWGGSVMEQALQELGIDISQVLHAEQEYEYITPLTVGDTVVCQAQISNLYTRKGMEFLEFVTQVRSDNGDLMLTDRSLLILRASGQNQ